MIIVFDVETTGKADFKAPPSAPHQPQDVGMDLKVALAVFSQMAKLCGTRVAHNIDFDDLMVIAGFHRIGHLWDSDRHLRFCTMKQMTDICAIPGPYGNKWPKLEEAYHYETGEPMKGAHDALADVMACLEIYKWIRENVREHVAT